MSTLLSGFDLIKLEENLRKEVTKRFGKVLRKTFEKRKKIEKNKFK